MESETPRETRDYAPVSCGQVLKPTRFAVQVLFILLCSVPAVWAIITTLISKSAMSVRQRAPRIAVIQIVLFMMFMILQLFINVLLLDGSLDGWATHLSREDITFPRYAYKFCRLCFRASFGYLTWFRAAVIWGKWRIAASEGQIRFWWISKALSSGRTLYLILFSGLFLFTLVFIGPGWFAETTFTLSTWFSPEHRELYKLFNSTAYRMFEISMMGPVAFISAGIPDLLSIRAELLVIFAVNWTSSHMYESRLIKTMGECTPIGLKTDFVITCMMLLILSLSTAYHCRPQVDPGPPPADLTRIYHAMKIKLIKERFSAFLNYRYGNHEKSIMLGIMPVLEAESPNNISIFSGRLHPAHAELSQDSIFDILEEYERHFAEDYREFRKTKCFKTIRKQLHDELLVYSMGLSGVVG